MSSHDLPRVARRIFNRAHPVTPEAASAVVGAVASRLGVRELRRADGEIVILDDGSQPEANLQGRRERGERVFAFDAQTGIAHIPIEGELVHRFGHLEPHSGMTGYDAIKLKVSEAAADPSVKGILLDIDSPGGEVHGVEAAAEAIFRAREAKPVWAIANELAASAAYWLASAAHVVVVPPTGDVGSVGVVMLHADFSRALDGAGVSVTLIHAGARKVDGNPFEPLPDPVRERFQSEVDGLYGRFAATVARNRGLSEAAVRETEAALFSGFAVQEAAPGLVDAVAGVDETIEEFAARLRQPAAVPAVG